MKRKNVSPSGEALRKLAPVLKTTVDWLLGESSMPLGQLEPKPEPPVLLVNAPLKLYRSVEAGPGFIVVDSDPWGTVPRPARLKDSPDAFAVVVSGESMSPEYEPGDMLFVDPYRPLVRDKNFIFIDDRNGDWKACVKKLRRWDAESYFVYQHNPPDGQERDFVLKKAEWPRAHRVLGKFDAE